MKTTYQDDSIEDSSANIDALQQKQGKILSSQQQNSSNKWSDKEIGCFWVMENKKGDDYLSGNIVIDGKVHTLHIYKNLYYKGHPQPKFKAYKI